MPSFQIDQPTPASVFDCALRFTMPSRSRPHEAHMVDLDAYELNGRCSCEHFQFKLEPFLASFATADSAVAAGLVKLRKNQHPDDALRCQHIVDAYRQFSVIAARAISHAKKNTAQAHL